MDPFFHIGPTLWSLTHTPPTASSNPINKSPTSCIVAPYPHAMSTIIEGWFSACCYFFCISVSHAPECQGRAWKSIREYKKRNRNERGWKMVKISLEDPQFRAVTAAIKVQISLWFLLLLYVIRPNGCFAFILKHFSPQKYPPDWCEHELSVAPMVGATFCK